MKTKTRFHKLTAWLLTLAMLLTMLPSFTFTALAAEHVCFDFDYNHHCDEDSCRKYIDCYDVEVDGRCDLCDACLTPVDTDGDNVCDFCGYCMAHTFVEGYWHSEDGYHYPECDRCIYYDYADGTACADGETMASATSAAPVLVPTTMTGAKTGTPNPTS